MKVLRLSILVALVACGEDGGRTRQRAAGDTADTIRAAGSRVAWFPDAMPLLLVPAHSNDRAVVVLADSTLPPLDEGRLDAEGTLFRLDGTAVPAQVTIGTGTEECTDAALEPPPAAAWGVGVVGGAARALAVDSLTGMARSDSTALTRQLFRLASSVPNTIGGRFAGLPFTLVSLWRFRTMDGRTVIAGTTRRQINQEDSPLEERTFVIAEETGAGDFQLVHSTRSAGAEETVEGTDLLAVVTWPSNGEIDVVISRDFGGQMAYAVVARTGPGAWKLRWSSRRFSC